MTEGLVISLADEAASLQLGALLAQQLRHGGVLFLQGTLGAGKTTLTRGILQALGHQGAVKSPTYTLVEPYNLSGLQLFHFDLYRLGDAEELEFMGIRDYFAPGNFCILEWPSRGQGYLPAPDLAVSLEVLGSGRLATLVAQTARGGQCLPALAAAWGQV